MDRCVDNDHIRTAPDPPRPATLHFEHVIRDGVVAVRASGAVDSVTAVTLDRCLRIAREAAASVVLDLTEVRYLDRAGLEVLVEHHFGCAARGALLRIVASDPSVLHTLRVSGLHRLLHVHRNLSAALAGVFPVRPATPEPVRLAITRRLPVTEDNDPAARRPRVPGRRH
ncbi:STAS domain-containing protein [Actinosynnema sp. NPDC047251]|uniref:Anti-sigma factor antagonist n=1 Tax=Saccharothrix espanaensis (strain ATCC 51144 / DSM 44229 / JCM 9112 / NBRC 15066 / NRRL 15764) TaxID=1179773 RepID=K0K6U4_SACES|nr:STAS domain-containing protein [Saccharothrix espanaensis]CCH32313.1 hypothetical protein BN6_50460 [Saccharothrix espanaensis DSM 44229]